MSTRSKAWLLIPYGVEPFAVAEYTVMEYLSATQPHAVPLTPPHCRAVLFWRNRIVPLLDFGALAESERAITTPKAVVLAYQPEPGAPLIHIAVALREPPVRISVDDEMACALPPENETLWQLLARSCFAHDGVATPIVSVAQLDSAEFRLHVEAHCTATDADATLWTTPPILAFAADGKPKLLDSVGGSASDCQEMTAEFSADIDSEIDIDADDEWDENGGEDFDDADDEFDEDEDNDLESDDWEDVEAFDEDDPTLGLEEDADSDADASAEWDEDNHLDDADSEFNEDDDLESDDWADMETLDEDDPKLDLEEDANRTPMLNEARTRMIP